MKNKIITAVVVALVVGAGAFYGGMKYQQSQIPSGAEFSMQGAIGSQQRQGAGANFRGANGNAGIGLANGEIIAKDDKSLTIKLRDGGSKIVFYSGSTQLQKMASTAIGDFEVGKQIVASGTANSDGSITAQSIQLRTDAQPAKN